MGRHGWESMTVREKLDAMKEIKDRNEQRAKEFAKMKVEQEKKYMLLVDLYVCGEISKEDFHRYIRKLRTNETTAQKNSTDNSTEGQ